MIPEPLDIAIIGAGTAGLSARSEVAKVTDRYRVFDPGPLGTTCARNGCMPSKAFLQSAHDLHRRHAFDALGLRGAEALRADGATVLAEVRRLRDGFVQGVIDGMEAWRDTHLIEAAPRFDAEGVLTAGGRRFLPRATVVATGSRPFVPEGWRERLGRRLLTTDDLFEIEELPERVAVIGLGPVGLELGQALARLGVEVTAFDPTPEIGGLTDTDLQARLKAALAPEMRIVEAKAEPEDRDGAAIGLRWEGGEIEVDRLLVAMGRRPNLDGLGLDRGGAAPGESGRPDLPDGRLNLPGTRIYFAGDIVAGPALLHEAADEGSIAGHFAARGEDARFRRRVALRMVFCEPQIALAGETGRAAEGGIVTGEAPFDDAGRARLQRRPGGLIRIEAEAASARLLGAAILGPEAEHLAHLLCHAIDRGDDLPALLRAPAYHPTHEEVLRRALRDALSKCDVEQDPLDAIRCDDPPVDRGAPEPRAEDDAAPRPEHRKEARR